MQLGVKCKMTAEFIQKVSGQKLTVDNEIGMEYNENSEEYESLCNRYESIIGFERNKNKDKFDKELLNIICKDVTDRTKKIMDKIIDVYKKSLTDRDFRGWIEFGGYILNPLDFSAVKFTNFRTQIFKQ